MRAEEVWEEFLRTGDIARAGQMILELVRRLKLEIISFIRGRGKGRERPRRKREVRLLEAELIELPGIRSPFRYPTVEELLEAIGWARRKAEGRREYLRIAEISEFDLERHVDIVRSIIERLRREGKAYSSLLEVSSLAGGLVITLVALLFLEKDGEVLLVQERPFGEIRVILNADGILGES